MMSVSALEADRRGYGPVGQLSKSDILTLLDCFEKLKSEGYKWYSITEVWRGPDDFFYFTTSTEEVEEPLSMYEVIRQHSSVLVSPVSTSSLKGATSRGVPTQAAGSRVEEDQTHHPVPSYSDDMFVAPDEFSEASTGLMEEANDSDSETSVFQEEVYKLQVDRTGGIIEVPYDGSEVIVGRSHDRTDYQLSGNSNISRQHMSFKVRNNTLYVVDMGSSNGTFLNGQRLTRPRKVKEGDVLTLGGDTVRVVS